MLFIRNIHCLVHIEEKPKLKYSGAEMNGIQTLENAFVLVNEGRIHSFGKCSDKKINEVRKANPGIQEINATGRTVFPSWVDSHTHLVYAGSREKEFVDRINGLSYEAIAERGGGILNSARILRKTPEEKLYDDARSRLADLLKHGTGAVEIKSGYGLDVDSELKMLRVIRKLKGNSSLTVKATFLGAHAVPEEFKNNKNGYLNLIIKEMLPAIAAEGLADFCDVFCEKNYFTKEDCLRLFEASKKYGMIPKVHAEQLSHTGGIEAGVESGAASVDHLEFASVGDMKKLKASETIPVILPGAQFFLGLQKPPVRKMIGLDLPVAISSDFNPGSCPSGNMNQMVSFACILYGMTPSEAIIAATTNSACAINLSRETGSIAVGKKANMFITRPIPSYEYLPYYFGGNLVEEVILNGEIKKTGDF